MARTYSWNAYETKLTSSITDSSTTISVESTIGLKGPGYLVLAPEDPALREYIMFATVVDGTTLNLSPLGRGLDGSTAGAQGHDSETILRAVSMAQMFDDLWEAILPPNGIGQELQDHIDDPGDPHALASYLKLDEATSLFVNRAGDSMTGYLTLYADPTADMHPATKRYVDAADPAGKYLLLSGGTMTGTLIARGNGASGVQFVYDGGTAFNFSHAEDGSLTVRRGIQSWMTFRQGANEDMTLHHPLDMLSNSLRNVGAPADDSAGMSRGYNDGRYLKLVDKYTNADAVAAMGARADSNDLNHDRYTDAEAVAAVGTVDTDVATGGSSTASPSGSVTGTGWTKVHTFVVNPPNAWGTARIVVRGVWHGAGVIDGNMQYQAHLNIGGNAGVDVVSGVSVIGDDPTLSMVHTFDTAADPVNVEVYVKDTMSNGGSVTNRYVDINYALYRVS